MKLCPPLTAKPLKSSLNKNERKPLKPLAEVLLAMTLSRTLTADPPLNTPPPSAWALGRCGGGDGPEPAPLAPPSAELAVMVTWVRSTLAPLVQRMPPWAAPPKP